MKTLDRFAPAKLNLFLAVTGRRPDGFHELVSLAAPLDWGDTLRLEEAGATTLECDQADLAVDETNLVLRAAQLFRAETRWEGHVKFALQKRIPLGAGLGGGSSDGVAALRALNEWTGFPLDEKRLATLAAQLGSDCALFLGAAPVVMRGRGEITSSAGSAAARISGRRVLIFKPEFSIATRWAFTKLAETPQDYVPASVANARLEAWLANPQASLESLLFNNMERVAFGKYVALPTLLQELRDRFALAPRMSGSGSACFAILPSNAPVAEISAAIRASWGPSAVVREARLV